MYGRTLVLKRLSRPEPWLVVLFLCVALVFPYLVPSYYLSLGIEVLIFAIFAMSLDLLLGYTGLPSFGHAAFFGLGCYLTAFVSLAVPDLLRSVGLPRVWAQGLANDLFVTLLIVVAGTGLAAFLVGYFSVHTSGIYFLMITLAFAQMLYSLAISWSGVTGGTDGLIGIARPVLGWGTYQLQFLRRFRFYYLVLVFFLLCWGLMYQIVRSPFGWSLRGIRDNEQRMEALGYDTFWYKVTVFVLGVAFAGVSGMLLTQFFWQATPDNLYWTLSGEALIMLIVGGTGTLVGPMLGAGIVRLLPNLVSAYTDHWQAIMGLVFVLFVLFAPQGIVGFVRRVRRRRDS